MPSALCRINFAVLALGAVVAGLSAGFAGETKQTRETSPAAGSFARVEVIFKSHCVRCHGGEAKKGELDLTTPAAILKGGESGAVVVPGKPEKSKLFEKVHKGEMPPKKKDPLSEAEIKSIHDWIAAGAKFDSDPVAESTDGTATSNQHDVIPIMLRRCTVCHGRHKQDGNLDLRTKAAMLRGGKSGPAIIAGNPDQSPLIKTIRAGTMPPKERLVEVSIKPIETTETELLVKWIAAGAPEANIEPDIASTTPDPLVSDKERDFWAFKPPRPVEIPVIQKPDRIHNPIDAFIEQKLEQKGLSLAPSADRLTLMRRAYFDLTGLPPEPAEVKAFLADISPDSYEKLLDRLLASPRYGERWGRFWLDIAGYADSEGKREQDLPRPYAWRYRDYVIRSLNSDKPYNRFLIEQIAGDELADYRHAAQITPEICDNITATAFLRMAPDPTWANITGYVPDRLDVVADEIDILGSAVMGLTLKCARCHSHKFDPIPQRDYYRMIDVFKGAYDEYDWLKPDVHPGIGPVSQDFLNGRHLPYVTTAERKVWEENNARIEQEIKALKAAPDGKVSDEAKKKIKALEAQRKPEPRVQALWDRGEPTPTYIYRRGDPLSPGRLVGPGVPSVLTDGKTPFECKPPFTDATSTGRRLAFAQWLTRPDHPLTARVAVNRLWKQHFGTGIVKSLGNFGKAGTPPTHPELLDWLAQEFVRQGWSFKAMHRLIMTSATYRQASSVSTDQKELDPDNALYSRMPLVRLDAEQLYDTLLLASGRLDETRFGPADPVHERGDGLITPGGTDRGWRRLVYVKQMRKQMATHLENFDFPQMNPNCVERRDSTVAPQALHLMNNGMVQQLAESFAARVQREAGADLARQVETTYWIALSRAPSAEEKQLGVEALTRLSDEWIRSVPPAATQPDRAAAARKSLTTYCHAIINSGGFLFVD